MVRTNWFLPEAVEPNGNGEPLAYAYRTVDNGYQSSGVLPLFSGQECAALLESPDGKWRTNVDASGIVLFGLGILPVTVQLPGGIRAVVEIADRPAEWRRSIPSAYVGDTLAEDKALWLRLFVDDVLAGEAWQEWLPMLYTATELFGETLQLAVGWGGWDGAEFVYCHLLPWNRGVNQLVRSSLSAPREETRQFGIGASLKAPLPGVYRGPGPISVSSAGPSYSSRHGMPCLWFTGHVLPLSHLIDYLPSPITPAAQVAASPGTDFAWADHPAAASVGHLPFSLTTTEVDGHPEWDGGISIYQSGPRHLGALSIYRYSDHAVVPASGATRTNLSPVTDDNLRLETMTFRWTFPESLVWRFVFGDALPIPVGNFVRLSTLVRHGAWGEWASRGPFGTPQAAEYVSGSGATYSVTIGDTFVSLSLRRHSLVAPYQAGEPGDSARVAKWELSWRVWIKGTSRESPVGSPESVTEFCMDAAGNAPRVFLSDADAASLLAGQEIFLTSPYSPNGHETGWTFPGKIDLQATGAVP